jgi:uncharacterized protein
MLKMKLFMPFVLMVGISCPVLADEMSDAMKAWETQNYQQAHQIFKKLAEAGNADAQRQLGEMIGFGEAVPEDAAQAEYWIKRAIALGNKEAIASLETVRQRGVRKAEIVRYTTSYDGAEIKLEKFGCVAPVIPAVSRKVEEVKELDTKMKSWRACYDKYESNLAAFLPVGKTIPTDLAALMSVAELERARTLMNSVYQSSSADAHKHALQLIAAYDEWAKRTRDYSIQFATVMKAEAENRQRQLDVAQERYKGALERQKAIQTGKPGGQ